MKNPLIRFIKILFNSVGLDIIRKRDALDYYLYEYKSYEEYKEIQVFHNKRKIKSVWSDERTLDRVAELVLQNSKDRTALGLCHGTRNGFEQNYLNSLGKGIQAIGTDISETALNFPNSVQWDFHDTNPRWIEKFDFIYTNSLDQSWQPKKALEVWLDQVNRYGLVIIEHTESHGPTGAGKMDPFGVRPIVFPYVLTMWFGDKISISHSVERKKNMNLDAWLFVLKKNDPLHTFNTSV
jgi:hypothetical protein